MTTTPGRDDAPEARLKALRLVGFKSFAEKTTVEFGPGISCVIGPNGSGKSNLADALRWALGEQGRSLRTRRAEDLIFAGSSTRRAIGMADVTLVIDNRDRLLPVDFGEIELGRRLFRSGENEYLLNRQRIRLRDLVDLLDEANLADNAFLFIGQGMVDQALALRPEERRPLFEEAAGIRKHERRRRAAEAELAEAEQNVERVRDVLAELRPQARRLAAQAEQQEQRQSAATELAAALVSSGRARLLEAERETTSHEAERSAARVASDRALGALRDAEDGARAITNALADRAERERELRAELDAARGRSLELQLAQARLSTESEALDRERIRVERDRTAIEQRRSALLREAALPVSELDASLETALRDAERALLDATVERDGLRAGTLVEADRRAAWVAARQAQDEALDRARRRRSELAGRVAEAEARGAEHGTRSAAVHAELANATAAAGEAVAADERGEAEVEAARQALANAEAAFVEANARRAAAAAELAALDARIATLQSALDSMTDQEALRAARRRGGALVAEGLDVDPELRIAVEAALGDALRGIVVDRDVAVALRDRRAVLIVPGLADGAGKAGDRAGSRDGARAAGGVSAAEAAGGGTLGSAIRRDPGGHVTRLLERTVWVPALEDGFAIVASLAPGWRVVTRAGEVVTDDGIVRVGSRASQLELEAQLRPLGTERERLAGSAAELEKLVAAAAGERDRTRVQIDKTRASAQEARSGKRVAEERERAVARRAEAVAREDAWNATSLERLREQLASSGSEVERLETEAQARAEEEAAARGADDDGGEMANAEADLARADQRVEGLRRARDERAKARAEDVQRHTALTERRSRAEIAAGLEENRLGDLELETTRIHVRVSELDGDRERITAQLATAVSQEQTLDHSLGELLEQSRDDRSRLAAAETAARDARELLRTAETRARSAEVGEMEARLRFDAARESLLVELAGIGPLAVIAIGGDAEGGGAEAGEAEGGEAERVGDEGGEAQGRPVPGSMEELGPALEAALSSALDRWRTEPAREPVTAARLASVRRRYHELGASNPFAAHEYAEIRVRVETLDAQRTDLEKAIHNTRELIANVNSLIADQFRRTFEQLEGAFARRFTQLFDGGEAQLSLTVPDDLSTTGVEITARPPGKKRQPLAMLSGGERTLTAVALLLAMLEVRPVPFCVLDEVDAALDEANIGRFSAALRELAGTIQFVVITHNRGTIEVADALYGVTVDDDAVSRVISMRLADLPPDARRERVGRDDLVPVGPAA